ncbi:hypothetical protein [Streptomyces sp. NPDC058701]|uniref:hypothetical protein n=1 Tax=Streptomyces sp. NPDC058701 TaxID=3346608 RepID=UPI00364F1EE5
MDTRRSVPITERPSPRFVLWREVLVAYAAPALSAGVGGLVSGRDDLAVAALTSIAGTSALVAALTGARLRRTGARPRRSASVPKPVLAAGAGLMAAVGGAVVAHLAIEGPGSLAASGSVRPPLHVRVRLAVARTPPARPSAVRRARRRHHHLAVARSHARRALSRRPSRGRALRGRALRSHTAPPATSPVPRDPRTGPRRKDTE